jgi:hypothetical protein
MIRMTLKAFRSNPFRCFPELFSANSRRFSHDLSIALHAPHRNVVVPFIRLL